MQQTSRSRQRSAPAVRGRSAERARCRSGSLSAQRPAVVGGLSQGTYSGFKVAVAVIVFHFGVKMLVQFADILLPFIMALLLCTVLEPVKQVTLEVLECTLIVLFQRVSCCGCCLRRVRRENVGGDPTDSSATPGSTRHGSRTDLHELMKRLLLLVSIMITVLLAGRLFWLVGRVVWLSGEAVTHDFPYYRSGVEKRGSQVRHLLKRFHLQQKAQLDMEHAGHWALKLLQYSAEFLTQHVFYTLTQISLTTIFVLFLLYSPVQRDFSPVMRVVFESMELYLKLKTLISLMMGITNGIALAIIGLELPAAWGLLTFLANFIPNIGGPVMSILPCAIALLDVRKSFYQVSAAFVAQFFLHFNIANFVEPVVFGTTEEIHSVVVLLGLSFFGYIWGFTGMFLSVPMLFAIHAWLKTVAQAQNCTGEARDDARFIMGILEGRWLADDDFGVEEIVDAAMFIGPIDSPTEGADSPAPETKDEPFQVLGADVPAERGESLEGASNEAQTSIENQMPISHWKVTTDLQAVFAVRDPDTDEVRLQGLVLRWVVLAGAYVLVFFGFTIFHWDLHTLIHPSNQPFHLHVQTVGTPSPTGMAVDAVMSTTGAASPLEAIGTTVSAGPATTAAVAAATTAVAAAVEATTTLVGAMAAPAVGQLSPSTSSASTSPTPAGAAAAPAASRLSPSTGGASASPTPAGAAAAPAVGRLSPSTSSASTSPSTSQSRSAVGEPSPSPTSRKEQGGPTEARARASGADVPVPAPGAAEAVPGSRAETVEPAVSQADNSSLVDAARSGGPSEEVDSSSSSSGSGSSSGSRAGSSAGRADGSGIGGSRGSTSGSRGELDSLTGRHRSDDAGAGAQEAASGAASVADRVAGAAPADDGLRGRQEASGGSKEINA